MSSPWPLTRAQWAVLLTLLVLNVVCLYCGAIPAVLTKRWYSDSTDATDALAQASATPATTPVAARATDPVRTKTLSPKPQPTLKPPARAATSTRTPRRIPSPTPTRTRTRTPAPTQIPAVPAPGIISARELARLELDPGVTLASKTSFFTSACWGRDDNWLQGFDNLAPADWVKPPGTKCIFGWGAKAADGNPTGHYSVYGGIEGPPRFYLIPPEAFARDQQTLKQLSQIKLIVDPDQGCASLGSIGITADGVDYECSACTFLKSGGVCPAANKAKRIVLPSNRNVALDTNATGGVYGFLGFPVVIFRKTFSLYFTGKDWSAPPRIYFENAVDTLSAGSRLKTTAEMTDQEVYDLAAEFDRLQTGSDPRSRIAPLEQDARSGSSAIVNVRPKETGFITITSTPGTVLSSIAWRIRPLNNIFNRQYLETNLCLDLNGEESCFTGVEDFAHCAFYTLCKTGYSSLVDTGHGEHVATRYFPAGTAPVLRDGKLIAKIQAPDIGTVLEIEVKARFRHVTSWPD